MANRRTMLGKLKTFIPFVGYFIVVVIIFGAALFPKVNQIIFAPDIWRYHYYQKPFLWTQLLNGSVPFWNPYIFSGQPYLEHPQVTAWYPFTILYLFLPIAYAISWFLALHIFIATVGMYWFCRKFVDTIPAWIGGLAFGLSSYYFGRIYAGHMEIIAASSWIPIVIGAFWDVSIRPNRFTVAVAGIVLSLQIFSGHAPVALYTLEAIGLLFLFKSVQKKTIRPTVAGIIAILLGFGIASVQLLPSQQFLSQSIRMLSLPNDWANVAVPTPANLIELLDPHIFYEWLPKVPLGHEHASYIGKLPLLFALAAILIAIRQKSKKIEIWWLLLLCVFSLWIALGNNVPIDLFSFMRRYVPFYKEFRIPSRHVILFVFAASALAAMGIARLRNTKIQIIIAVLVLLDLVPMFRHDVVLGEIPEVKEDSQLTTFLRKDKSLYRYLPDFYHGDMVRENFEFDTPMNYGIYSVSGYDQPPLRNYYRFLMAVNGVKLADIVPYIETVPPFTNITSPFINFLNIKYIAIPISNDPPLQAVSDQFSLLRDASDRGYRLYNNTKVLPRFFMVSKAVSYSVPDELFSALQKNTVDPSTTVLLVNENTDNLGSCSTKDLSPVRVISYLANSITVQTDNRCGGYLVSSEVYYPGWTALIDGKSVPLLEGNGAFRTVFVPKGNHTVVMSYVPKIYFISLGISIILLTGSFFVLLKTAPKKKY